ncbi:hypothetical protein WR25_14798 [Diploscapter pachys]|uniref:Receptor L-domain domain-containing protein n=1 Tax=Diploscapter pachys TaxID=2018661 RepID=A0A2A2JGB9_9BILA|nr:hypothetical protein WR25_14798 [Diploscapter pachys]
MLLYAVLLGSVFVYLDATDCVANQTVNELPDDCTKISGVIYIDGSTETSLVEKFKNVEIIPCLFIMSTTYPDLKFFSNAHTLSCPNDTMQIGAVGFIVGNQEMTKLRLDKLTKFDVFQGELFGKGIFLEGYNTKLCYDDEEYYRLMSSQIFFSADNRLCSMTGQKCTAELPSTDYNGENTEDTEYSDDSDYTFNSQSLPSNCEVVNGYMTFNEDDSESEDLKQKLSSIRIIVGSLYIQYSSFTTFELPNLEYFIGMLPADPWIGLTDNQNLVSFKIPKLKLLIDPLTSLNKSVMMVSNPALSISQTTCERWTQLGFSLIIHDNAANCEGSGDTAYEELPVPSKTASSSGDYETPTENVDDKTQSTTHIISLKTVLLIIVMSFLSLSNF